MTQTLAERPPEADYRQQIARGEEALRRLDAEEQTLREGREYRVTAGQVLLWMVSVPATVAFLGACVIAIASN